MRHLNLLRLDWTVEAVVEAFSTFRKAVVPLNKSIKVENVTFSLCLGLPSTQKRPRNALIHGRRATLEREQNYPHQCQQH